MDKEKLVRILDLMYRIRLFEERTMKLFREGLIVGALHHYIGEEAIAVGACAAVEKDDYVVSTHRGHGHCIAKGADLKRMMAELMGRETGYSRGRGGSMHIFNTENGLLGGNGIVGGGLPIALGSAFSGQYRESGQVTLCFFAEGAAARGSFHESLNLAALWKLPVVYICENNLWSATTYINYSLPIENIGDRASAYGIPGKVIDGNDVENVYRTVDEAIKRARAGKGPTLIECKTYRHYPHCMVIPDTRPQDEVQEWKKKDPIPRFEKKLLEEKVITETEIKGIKEKAKNMLDEAEEFARKSPVPEVETVEEGLWA